MKHFEYLGEKVWSGGMVGFLLKKKQEGRLGGIFCTTHGTPDYISRLIKSGCFDAVMLAYNPWVWPPPMVFKKRVLVKSTLV